MSDEPRRLRRGRRGRRPPFLDQALKLDYILNARGDRRRREARRPEYARPDPEGWPSLAGQTKIVSTQTGLGAPLGTDDATVSRWFNGHEAIPSLELATICRIFDVDELSFRIDAYREFEGRCARSLPFGAMPPGGGWRRLLTRAERGRLRILLEDPWGDPYASARDSRRYASTRPSGDGAPLPTVAQDEPFWIGASSLSDEEGVPLWADWSLMLLNEDRGRDWFKSLVPGDAEPEIFGPGRFPADARTLYLPRQPILRHHGDLGEFAMILVLSAELCPSRIVAHLADADAEGRVIEGTLDHLAAWLTPRMEEGGTAVLVAPYRVVQRPNST